MFGDNSQQQNSEDECANNFKTVIEQKMGVLYFEIFNIDLAAGVNALKNLSMTKTEFAAFIKTATEEGDPPFMTDTTDLTLDKEGERQQFMYLVNGNEFYFGTDNNEIKKQLVDIGHTKPAEYNAMFVYQMFKPDPENEDNILFNMAFSLEKKFDAKNTIVYEVNLQIDEDQWGDLAETAWNVETAGYYPLSSLSGMTRENNNKPFTSKEIEDLWKSISDEQKKCREAKNPAAASATEAKKDPATEDPATKDPESKDPESKDPESKDPESKDPESKDPESKEPDNKDPATEDPVKT
jgi:hypothetical protein